MLLYRSILPIIVFWALVVASLFFSSAFYLAFFGFVPILFTSAWAIFFLNAISYDVEGDYLAYVALGALIPTQMFSVVLFTEIRYWKPVRCLIVESPFHAIVYLVIVLLLPTLLGFLIWWAKKRQRMPHPL